MPARAKFETDQQYAVRNNALFAHGVSSGSTDNSGSLVITYSLASTPRTVIANSVYLGQTNNLPQYSITVTNMNATGSTLRFYGTGSGFIGNATGVTASWAAWV